jgi:hypothetical protein
MIDSTVTYGGENPARKSGGVAIGLENGSRQKIDS